MQVSISFEVPLFTLSLLRIIFVYWKCELFLRRDSKIFSSVYGRIQRIFEARFCFSSKDALTSMHWLGQQISNPAKDPWRLH